jgi:hypothetical protein
LKGTLDFSPVVLGILMEPSCFSSVSQESGCQRGTAESGHSPKVVPVVEIVGAQVLGGNPSGKKAEVRARYPPGFPPLSLDPVCAARETGVDLPEKRDVSRELVMLQHYPEHLTVRIPLTLLRDKIALLILPAKEMEQLLPCLVVITQFVERVNHESGIANPTIGVRQGSGSHREAAIKNVEIHLARLKGLVQFPFRELKGGTLSESRLPFLTELVLCSSVVEAGEQRAWSQSVLCVVCWGFRSRRYSASPVAMPVLQMT